jgi:peptide chain release factor 1
MLPVARLEALISRHAMIEAELATSLAPDAFVKLSREFAELSPVVEIAKQYKQTEAELADLEAMLADSKTDPEMARLAAEEKPNVTERLAALEEKLRIALLPKDAMDERDVILEVRAGTGGDEAALFAGDLFRMYERYAALQGWKTEIVSMSEGAKGGFKEIIAGIHGRGAFAKLKFESGVHRVQRLRPHPHFSGDRRSVAGSRRSRRQDRRQGLEDRHHARAGRRRPARQQDRIRRAHHAFAHEYRDLRAGRALAA